LLGALLVLGSLAASPSAGATPVDVARLERRGRSLTAELSAAAGRVAHLEEARESLKGDRAKLPALFGALAASRERFPERPALAVRATPLETLAWSGRITDVSPLQVLLGQRWGLFVLDGALSTTLVYAVPVTSDEGVVLGFATAELAVSIRRHIHNEFLEDEDLLADGDASLRLRYVDSREAGEVPVVAADERAVRASDGRVLAYVQAVSQPPDPRERLEPWIRAGIAGLAALLLVALSRRLRVRSPLGVAAAATGLRAALAGVPWAVVLPSPLTSPEVYASPVLGPLLETPLDLFLTTAWVFCLAVLAMRQGVARAPRPPSRARTLVADVIAVPIVGLVFAAFSEVATTSSVDVETISPFPRSAVHVVLQWSLLLILASGSALLVTLFCRADLFGGPWRQRLRRGLQWAAIGVATTALWPRGFLGLPLLPAVALYLASALVASSRSRWVPGLMALSPGQRAGTLLVCVAAFAVLLHPSLVHFREKATRRQIESEYAPAVLRQPRWREHVLSETERRIDALRLLEEANGPPPLVDELAFAVWSSTDLAAFGFSSAVEIQDPSGAVISRFALNLSSLSGSPKPLPNSDEWLASAERLSLASTERSVLHARRRLVYHGALHGAVHLYVGEDHWNLPFLTGRDPYSVLYRPASRTAAVGWAVDLVAFSWEREVRFSSLDRPPTLTAPLVSRVLGGPYWTTLEAGEGGARHIYVFAGPEGVYCLAYPRVGAGRFAAELVESVSGTVLTAAAALLLLMLIRTLRGRSSLSIPAFLGSVRQRFSLRLFVTFIAVATAPILVLEVVVREFVAARLHRESEDQALERAAVAQKAVEDFAFFQRGEAPGRQPVTDAALVWVASLIRNDLDVFQGGKLLASSKRELYSSGLLAPRVSGRVFRAIALEGRQAVLGTERIGGFSYMVVAVPVKMDEGRPAILSIPLALRQREVQAVLSDLDRTIRLASIVFLMVAGALAHSMARRISGPVRDLTRAAQRIARGDLLARVSTSSRDEFQGLVESFNQMAGDLERQRRDIERSNRIAAWAEMARQVAHEVKNPLTPIQLSAEHLRRVFDDAGVDFRSTLEACVATILRQVAKLREIVTEFSAFARPPASLTEVVDLTDLAAEVLRPYQGVVHPGVALELEAHGGPGPTVRAERRLLERAIVNLLENALQAVGERGRIVLRVGLGRDSRTATIEVADSGPGLDAEALERAFEPFFSTKTGGSGLGLALVRKIAEDHGGGAELESTPRGTTARLWLPTPEPRPTVIP
jgi:signal transduction histidine kinase